MASITQGAKCASEVNDIVKRLLEPGKSPADVAQFYNDWAGAYENDLSMLDYILPKLAAQELSDILDEKRDSRILDCGAGTGLAGLELAELGYSHIDALDPSPIMLEKAKEKGVYTNMICAFLDANQLKIADDVYDAVLLVGCLCEGHVTPDSFHELSRITKPGGHILLTTNVDYVNDKSINFEPSLKVLEESGRWRLCKRKFFPNVAFGKDYFIFHLQVC